MDLFREIRAAQANWIASALDGNALQAMSDARRLLAQAVAERNDAMIRVYSETCLLLLEANRKRAVDMIDLFTPVRKD